MLFSRYHIYFVFFESIHNYDNFENDIMYIVSSGSIVVIVRECQWLMGKLQATAYEYGHEHVIYASIRA